MTQNDISKRHQNDIKTTFQNSIENVGYFSDALDRSCVIYAQKMGKITSAIYLVTEVMDQENPLAISLRKVSLDTVAMLYQGVGEKKSTDFLARVLGRIQEVGSLIEIGAVAHHVSVMNASVILEEISKIATLVGEDLKTLQKQVQKTLGNEQYRVAVSVKKDSFQNESFDDLMKVFESKRHQNDIKTTLTTSKRQDENQNDINDIKTTSQNDIDRKQEILSLIKSKNTTTIHDIKSVLSHYSDKTIQRELASLIDLGLIKREGNKRWTVYRAV